MLLEVSIAFRFRPSSSGTCVNKKQKNTPARGFSQASSSPKRVRGPQFKNRFCVQHCYLSSDNFPVYEILISHLIDSRRAVCKITAYGTRAEGFSSCSTPWKLLRFHSLNGFRRNHRCKVRSSIVWNLNQRPKLWKQGP